MLALDDEELEAPAAATGAGAGEAAETRTWLARTQLQRSGALETISDGKLHVHAPASPEDGARDVQLGTADGDAASAAADLDGPWPTRHLAGGAVAAGYDASEYLVCDEDAPTQELSQ